MKPEQFVFTNGTDEAIQVFVNTYVDDGQEVVLLKPSYAMYRFYSEVAGARIKEVAYPHPGMEFPLQEVLDAITPETRAVIFANPNNPTGTGISLLGIERILHRARKAVVMVDEAYYEFSGVTALTEIERVPNLFVCRTFSKVFGMAAMRLGCLFSHEANVALLHKAQSPYSVNSLAVLAAQAAMQDTDYVETYVAEVLAARELLCFGLEKLGITYVPSSGEFRAGPLRQARDRSARRAARRKASWCATAAMKRPDACASPWARANRPAACWRNWRRSGTDETAAGIRHGWRAGGRHRILPRDHRAHRGALHRHAHPHTR